MTKSPSLENLKKQAKALLRAWSAGDAEAITRVRVAHPRYANLSDDQVRVIQPRLTDCQLVLAHESGFASWPQLKVAIEAARQDLPDEFVGLACLCHDDPHYDHRSFHVRAHELLRENPWIAGTNIWTAAAAGNTSAVAAFLDAQPALVDRPGPHGWLPLICACYSRVAPLDPRHSTFDVARLLLDRGGDPNAFTMKGNADERFDQRPRRFTALSSLFGGGSTGFANQPPHPRGHHLAELLLARGANPADEQALNLNQRACLEMFLRHGLQPNAVDTAGKTLLGRALSRAARNGDEDHVKLLLEHHARLDETFEQKTPWEHAVERGNLTIARLLAEAGTPISDLSDVEQFVAAIMAGDETTAGAMLQTSPDLMTRAPKDMVHRAVGINRTEAVKLVLELGFDPNYQDDNPPITMTGVLSQNEEILRLLLKHGASLKLRDPWYDSTAIGWADFFDCKALRDLLLDEPDISLFDALEYDRLDRVADILARDPDALERPFATYLTRPPKPEDWNTPLERMIKRGKTEAVELLRSFGATA